MLGIYIAYTLVDKLGAASASGRRCCWRRWPSGLLGRAGRGAAAAAHLRAPELFQLLATFALVLVIKDAALWLWGPKTCSARARRGCRARSTSSAGSFPTYDLLLIVVGPVVLGLLWLLLTRTRWGTLVRAATQDREMVGALGVNQAWLFTGVFALGACWPAWAARCSCRASRPTLDLDLHTIGDAFVVVVVGGMGSIPGAFVAALLIAEIKAICIWHRAVDGSGSTSRSPSSRWWSSSW
jgi:branched-chain amino acid transport system permease protein